MRLLLDDFEGLARHRPGRTVGQNRHVTRVGVVISLPALFMPGSRARCAPC
jgi:hypothetical protein